MYDYGKVGLSRAWRVTAALLALMVLAAGCAGDEPAGDAGDDTTVDTTEDADSTEVAAEPQTIEIDAKDFSFDMPASISAGLVRLHLTNSGEQPHHAQLARLNEGVTVEDLQQAFQEEGEAALRMVTFTGGPSTVDPGGEEDSLVELAEGSYVMLCFVADPADGVPHFAKGMMEPFEVTAAEGEAEAPEVAGEIMLDDFEIVLPEEFGGSGVYRVVNKGEQPHEVSLLKLQEGKTGADVEAFFTQPAGPPPFESAGGFQAISPGEEGFLPLDLGPGQYLALCHVPDPESGESHAALGMVAEFSVE